MRTTGSRSAAVLALSAAVVVLTTGCIIQPPNAVPPQPAATTAAPPAQTSEAPEPTQAEPTEAAPSEGPYEITAEGQDGSVWSFEVTDSRVVETDSLGDAAQPGHQLVEVLVDAQILEGEPNFYYAFHVYIVDDATGDEWGLSSASEYYAENDLFSIGTQPSFTDGVGIFHIPATVGIDHVRVTTDSGGVWDFTR